VVFHIPYITDDPCYETIGESAAKQGRFDILQWMHTKQWRYHEGFGIATGAAFTGRLDIIQWAAKNGYPCQNCYFHAIDGGHFELLKWLFENGFVLQQDDYNFGRLDMLQWVVTHNKCLYVFWYCKKGVP